MADIDIRTPTLADLETALPTIRPEDRKEWFAGTTCNLESLAKTYITEGEGEDRIALVMAKEGRPLVFLGCDGPYLWFFATQEAYDNLMLLHRHREDILEMLHDKSPVLLALSDSRNTNHHSWLQFLGFRYHHSERVGSFKVPFKMFMRNSLDVR